MAALARGSAFGAMQQLQCLLDAPPSFPPVGASDFAAELEAYFMGASLEGAGGRRFLSPLWSPLWSPAGESPKGWPLTRAQRSPSSPRRRRSRPRSRSRRRRRRRRPRCVSLALLRSRPHTLSCPTRSRLPTARQADLAPTEDWNVPDEGEELDSAPAVKARGEVVAFGQQLETIAILLRESSGGRPKPKPKT